MTEENKKIHVSVEKGIKTLEIREGRLNDIDKPKRVKIIGVITGVNEFISKRASEFKKQYAHIVYSYDQ